MKKTTKKPKYYIMKASALPEVFLKVAEAKRLLAIGKAPTVNEAAKMVDLSRSAFYKYRDTIMPFHDLQGSRIITYQVLLHDEPGALNNLLTVFSDHAANIITINSIVPSDGTSIVTIAAETVSLELLLEDFLELLRKAKGVIRADVLAG